MNDKKLKLKKIDRKKLSKNCQKLTKLFECFYQSVTMMVKNCQKICKNLKWKKGQRNCQKVVKNWQKVGIGIKSCILPIKKLSESRNVDLANRRRQ
jgi:hypothetical protein